MKKLALSLTIGVLLFTILFACAPKSSSIEKTSMPGPLAQQVLITEKGDWQGEWEKTLAEARKEGKVVVYSSASGNAVRDIAQDFERKYGIAGEFVAGRGGELTEKLLRERRAGLYLVDAYISGLGTSLFYHLKPADAVDSLERYFILPDISDPKSWYKGLGWIDDEHTALAFAAYALPSLAVNTDMVKEGEIKSWKDLLNPRWKGKIVMNDPIPTGTGQRFIGFLSETMGEEYLKELAKQEPMMVRDQRLQIEWLARGKYATGTSPKSDILWNFARAGAPVRVILMEGMEQMSAGGGNIAVFKNPPHSNAVKVFVNWLLSYDGGLSYSKAMGVQSRREDVPVEHLDPIVVRKTGVKYFDQNRREFVLREPEFVKLARDLFGPLLK